MAILQLVKLKESELKIVPTVDGQVLYCTDTRKVFYDNEDELRKEITNDCLIFKTESERLDFSNPLVNKITIVLSTEKLYQFDGIKWLPLITLNDLVKITTTLKEYVPGILIKDNKLLAPRTAAQFITMNNGSNLINAIDENRKLHVAKNRAIYVQATEDRQKIFVIPYPIQDFDLVGNYMTVLVKGQICDPSLYTVNGDYLLFNSSVNDIKKNEKILFIFYYSEILDINKNVVLDRCNYMDKSITTEKLSDDIRINANNIVENTERIFFTNEEKEKLHNIEENATHYVHPATHPATMITQDSNHRFVTDGDKQNWNGKANATDVYTKAETDARIQHVIGSAPEALDTLKEIANALGNDENFSATITTELGKKATKEEFNELKDVVDTKTDKNDYIRNGIYTTPNVVQKTDGTYYAIQIADTSFREYIDGMLVNIKIEESNTKGPAKLSINGLANKPIITQEGYELVPEELVRHSIYSLRFNGTNGNFILQGKGGVKVLDTAQESYIVDESDQIIRGELVDIHDNKVRKTVPKSKTISFYETKNPTYYSEGKIRVLSIPNFDKFILLWIENSILKAQLIEITNGYVDIETATINNPTVINSNCTDFEAERVGNKFILTYSTHSNVVNMVSMYLDSDNSLRVGLAKIIDENELVVNLKLIPINNTDAIISWEHGVITKALLVRLDNNDLNIIFTRDNLEYRLDSHVVVNPTQIVFAYSENEKISAWVMVVTRNDFSATGKVDLVANRNVSFTDPTLTFLGGGKILSMWTNTTQTELYKQFIEVDFRGGINAQEPKTYMNDVYKIKSNVYPVQHSIGDDFYLSASPYYGDIPSITDEGKNCLKLCITKINKDADLYKTVDVHTTYIGKNVKNITSDFITNNKMIIAFNAKNDETDKSHIFFAVTETRKTPEGVAISNGDPKGLINVLKW